MAVKELDGPSVEPFRRFGEVKLSFRHELTVEEALASLVDAIAYANLGSERPTLRMLDAARMGARVIAGGVKGEFTRFPEYERAAVDAWVRRRMEESDG